MVYGCTLTCRFELMENLCDEERVFRRRAGATQCLERAFKPWGATDQRWGPSRAMVR